MLQKMLSQAAAAAVAGTLLFAAQGAVAQDAIDNSALSGGEFRPHARTFGLVYTLPDDVTGLLQATVAGPLREDLLNLGLEREALNFNIPHITVVHVHNTDPTTPEKMLAALPALPPVLSITLKNFYTTEAAKGAGHPWWLDLGVVKEGESFEAMMAFNTTATAALTPLRDGPLPRCTGPVYAAMSDAAKELVRTVGVSGVNVVRNGEELRSHNPHTTLVYSMALFSPEIQAAMKRAADNFNQILPEGIATTLKTVSIVELGFSGNVLREIYRINLEDGSVLTVASGEVKAAQ